MVSSINKRSLLPDRAAQSTTILKVDRSRCNVGNDITPVSAPKVLRADALLPLPWSGVVEQRTASSATEIEMISPRVFRRKIINRQPTGKFLICEKAAGDHAPKGVLPAFDVGKQGFRESRGV